MIDAPDDAAEAAAPPPDERDVYTRVVDGVLEALAEEEAISADILSSLRELLRANGAPTAEALRLSLATVTEVDDAAD